VGFGTAPIFFARDAVAALALHVERAGRFGLWRWRWGVVGLSDVGGGSCGGLWRWGVAGLNDVSGGSCGGLWTVCWRLSAADC